MTTTETHPAVEDVTLEPQHIVAKAIADAYKYDVRTVSLMLGWWELLLSLIPLQQGRMITLAQAQLTTRQYRLGSDLLRQDPDELRSTEPAKAEALRLLQLHLLSSPGAYVHFQPIPAVAGAPAKVMLTVIYV